MNWKARCVGSEGDGGGGGEGQDYGIDCRQVANVAAVDLIMNIKYNYDCILCSVQPG